MDDWFSFLLFAACLIGIGLCIMSLIDYETTQEDDDWPDGPFSY